MLEDATDWIGNQAARLSRPYLGYYHLYPPHAPYVVRRDFADLFTADGYQPVRKPRHFILEGGGAEEILLDEKRLAYNQAIRYVDVEFGRLMEELEQSGQLENTWVILTSDHGEMFERGIAGHLRTMFYQSLVKTPLLIFKPRQTERVDVHQPTSAIDLIPTLLHLTGRQIPDHLEGVVLPPFGSPPTERSIFALDAQHNPPDEPLSLYTAMLLKWPYKLTQYTGYDYLADSKPFFELYNLTADPEN